MMTPEPHPRIYCTTTHPICFGKTQSSVIVEFDSSNDFNRGAIAFIATIRWHFAPQARRGHSIAFSIVKANIIIEKVMWCKFQLMLRKLREGNEIRMNQIRHEGTVSRTSSVVTGIGRDMHAKQS